MKKLVKRMLKPYHLELGCVEAYGDNTSAPSDTTATVNYDFSGTYHPAQDSMNVEVVRTEIKTVNGDTVSTQRDTSNRVITPEVVKEEKGWWGKRAWDGMVEWIFSDEDDT